MPKNPQKSLEKWQRNMGQAAEAMRDGIAGVTESPNAKAADSADKYARNVAEAVSSGKFARRNREVTLSDWKQAATDKGVANMQNGVRALGARAKRAITDQLAKAQAISQQIAGMPNVTEADAEARMLTAMRLMRQTGRDS